MYHPLRSLREGHWFKLICGASFQHLPAVRNLTLAFALAGADCVDVAADPAVIASAYDALNIAERFTSIARRRGFRAEGKPWLMVSLNDGEDPHFRKAEFEPTRCPASCPRPCETVCPAQAIVFDRADGFSGVIDSQCYGCGRCLAICPIQHIAARSYVSTPAAIAPLVLQGVDAVEIHTQVGRLSDFERLWKAIAPSLHQLKLVAISCTDGDELIDYLWSLHDLISPLPCPLIWQTDGRSMSGDIGDGATHATIRLGQKVLEAGLPGYVQLAGGTNRYTTRKLNQLGLLSRAQASANSQQQQQSRTSGSMLPSVINSMAAKDCPDDIGQLFSQNASFEEESVLLQTVEQEERSPQHNQHISGIAYGSYARVLLAPVLEQLEAMAFSEHPYHPSQLNPGDLADLKPTLSNTKMPFTSVARLEDVPELLWQAVDLANSLVSQLKSPMTLKQVIPR